MGFAAWYGHLPVLRLMVRKYGCSVEERTKVGQAYTGQLAIGKTTHIFM